MHCGHYVLPVLFASTPFMQPYIGSSLRILLNIYATRCLTLSCTATQLCMASKRSLASEQLIEQLAEREWGIMLCDEVHRMPADVSGTEALIPTPSTSSVGAATRCHPSCRLYTTGHMAVLTIRVKLVSM